MKILIIHASAGAGHFKAAESIYSGIKKSTGHDAVLVDALDYSSPFFKKLYTGTYYFLISKLPWLWGFFFWLLDIDCLQPLVRFVRRIYNTINTGKLHRFLKEEQFAQPEGITFDPSGNLYISNEGSGGLGNILQVTLETNK